MRHLHHHIVLTLGIGLAVSLGNNVMVRGQEADSRPAATDAALAQLYDGFDGYKRSITTNSPDAQRWFNQGIQWLYGFNHDEAIRSFEKAAEIDPTCAMAWWGSAYARGIHINNPQMGEEQSRLADAAAQSAVDALDTESAIEQALISALRVRYTWPAPEDRAGLDQAYAAAMEKVWHQYPDDPDVGTLFAESLMNLQPWDLWTGAGAPKGRALEIVAVLERTLRVAPDHPGANHFYIHAIEASPWPERGLDVANRLGKLVPGSGHLVHMPSHIYIRVGQFADAARANEQAIAVDDAYLKIAPPPQFYNVYYLHNVHFLAYSAMMEGRYQVAIDAARQINKKIPQEFLKEFVKVADGFMPTAYHVQIRFGKWKEILAETAPEEWQLFSRADRHAARAIALASLGKLDEAQAELNELDILAKEFTDEWLVGVNKASEVIAVARTMAQGELEFHRGDRERAFETLRKAVAREEALRYDEPPGWMQPVRHALGALLMADNRFADAEEVYRADLVRHPNNAWSLLGLEQALARQGKTGEAKALSEKVQQAWARADVKPVASCYCHPDALAAELETTSAKQ